MESFIVLGGDYFALRKENVPCWNTLNLICLPDASPIQ